MARGFNSAVKRRRWSKLQKQVHNLFCPELKMKIYCTVYTQYFPQDTFDDPRWWITLDKKIIWDFPSQFLEWKHPELKNPVEYLDCHGLVSPLLRQYLDTPQDELLTKSFEDDHWGLIDILRAADRRIGKKQLLFHVRNMPENRMTKKIVRKRWPQYDERDLASKRRLRGLLREIKKRRADRSVPHEP